MLAPRLPERREAKALRELPEGGSPDFTEAGGLGSWKAERCRGEAPLGMPVHRGDGPRANSKCAQVGAQQRTSRIRSAHQPSLSLH